MKTLKTILILALLSPLSAFCKPQQVDFIVRNVNIIPMNSERVIRDHEIAIKDGKIFAIYPEKRANRYQANASIDAQDQYALPGLADMHSHMRMPAQSFFNLMIANGITTTAHMRLADGDKHVENREAIHRGKIIGPRYIVGGPMLSHENIKELSDVENTLRLHEEESYDFIKIHDDLEPELYDALISGAKEKGLRVTGHTQRLEPLQKSFKMDSIEHIEEFLYVTDEGLSASPGNFEDNVDKLIKAYLNNFEKLQDADYRQRLAKEVADSGIYITATLIIYEYIAIYVDDERFRAMLEDPLLAYLPESKRATYTSWDENQYRKNFFTGFGPLIGLSTKQEVADHFAQSSKILALLTKDFHDAGVPLMLGADAFGAALPGFSIHQELALLVDAGLSPYQALQTGTSNVAKFLGDSKTRGTIEKGKTADFILVPGNPLENIAHTSKVAGVFSHNQWHSQSDIARLKSEALDLIKTADSH